LTGRARNTFDEATGVSLRVGSGLDQVDVGGWCRVWLREQDLSGL